MTWRQTQKSRLAGTLALQFAISFPVVLGLDSVALAQTMPAETLTVDGVVRDVVLHNDRARAASFMEEAARKEIGPAGAWDDPMLMLGVQNLPTSFRFDEEMMTMKMVELSQKVPYAGEKGLLKKSRAAEAGAVHEERRETVLGLVTATKMAYAELYYHKQLIEDLTRQRSLYEQIVANAQSRLIAGRGGLDEVAAAQAGLWRIDAELLSHHNDIHTAYQRLQALRGEAPDETLPLVAQPPHAVVPDSVETWFDAAHDNYPPLRRLERQSERYEFAARAANRMSWPMLELGVGYGFREDLRLDGERMPQDNMLNFQATFSLPLFAGRQQRNMARSMMAMRFQAEAEQSQLGRDIAGELHALHQRAARLDTSLAVYREKIIPADEQAFQSALSGYAAGRTSMADLLNYALGVYRDRTTASQLDLSREKTLIDVGQYITNVDEYLGANK